MRKSITTAIAALAALGTVAGAVPASAQSRYRDSDHDGRSDRAEWNRDRDRDGRPDQYDRRDNRRDNRWNGQGRQQWRYYGGNYGYNGYNGRWRTGQRYANWRDSRYYVNDWRAYDLPPPRPGYRYYRDRNGDVVMAAVATGVIGLIIGGALAR
jgi:Ni/Co efflux regulator RcnB